MKPKRFLSYFKVHRHQQMFTTKSHSF